MTLTGSGGGLVAMDHHTQDQPVRGLARTLAAGAVALVAAAALAVGAAGAGAQSTTPTTPADPPAQTAPGEPRDRDCPEEEGAAGGDADDAGADADAGSAL